MPRAKSANFDRKMIDKILSSIGAIATVALLAMGGLAWWAYSFVTTQVTTELSSQQIFFPPAGSPALASSDIGPYLNQYAGQQLTDGNQAHAYANHFIGVHLKEIAGGDTYAQISSKALADPTNTKLQQQKQTLFQGETLRGLLLNAYAFWTVGMIAQLAALVAFAAGGGMALLTLLGFWHMMKRA